MKEYSYVYVYVIFKDDNDSLGGVLIFKWKMIVFYDMLKILVILCNFYIRK